MLSFDPSEPIYKVIEASVNIVSSELRESRVGPTQNSDATAEYQEDGLIEACREYVKSKEGYETANQAGQRMMREAEIAAFLKKHPVVSGDVADIKLVDDEGLGPYSGETLRVLVEKVSWSESRERPVLIARDNTPAGAGSIYGFVDSRIESIAKVEVS